MGSAFVVDDRMDLVDDDRPHGAKCRARPVGGKQNEQRLGCSDDDVRWLLGKLLPFPDRRIAGSQRRGDGRKRDTTFQCERRDFRQRSLKIFLDVVAQRLERRDVENLGFMGQSLLVPLAHQAIEADEKGCERFSRTSWGGDQHVVASLDERPGLLLRLRRA